MAKVLLVEDDSFLGYLFSTSIRESGLELIYVTSGEDALEKMRSEKPDIVLLDIILPGINGYEVLQRIKADFSDMNVPVIMISNLGDQASMNRAKELGATYYFVKSNVLPRDIIQKVREVLKIDTPA